MTFISRLDVYDYPTQGFFYTWHNKREGGDRIYFKHDRVHINTKDLQESSHLSVEALAPIISLPFSCYGKAKK